MTKSFTSKGRFALRTGAASLALGLALVATPGLAQVATAAATDTAPEEVIVTGSIVRNPAAATASPVVSLTTEDLASRGIITVTDALQLLTANNGGTNPPSWSANGFAKGASAPSLRGLNDAYTLTLFDGLRTAAYPLADDGYRTFVDINSIPSSVVNRVDVLLDGASASYGSDAIAGVVNVISKQQVTGVHLNGSAGLSLRGDAGERRISGTIGYGDLKSQGFNVYIGGEYQKTDPLYVRERKRPFNTADWSDICNDDGSCLANAVRNGIQADGSYNGFVSTTVPFVRPYDATTGAALGSYQALNPAAGCGNLPARTLTADQLAGAPGAPATVCQLDLVNTYNLYTSRTERKGATFRATADIGSNAQAWFMFNFYNVTTDNPITPYGFTGTTAPAGVQVPVQAIFLPAYVCAQGTGSLTTIAGIANSLTGTGCDASNGTLNPNNPFAASGQLARLLALPDVPRETDTNSKLYRWAGGIHGTLGDNFVNYNLQATTSKSTLDVTQKGFIYLQGLMDAVATGGYNFVDPSQNTEEQRQAVFPDNRTRSWSKLTQVQLAFDKDLFQLPGGNLNVAVMGEYRYEAINNPSANPANDANPTERYFAINAVGVSGSRRVWSGAYEVTAPILSILRAKASGSYNSYSTGQSAFSPKFEAELQAIDQVKLRGTWSKGFRAPSFAEAFSLPTTGYQNAQINCAQPTFAAFCAAHAGSPDPTYLGLSGYSFGVTSAGNPDLKPEKSESFTLGAVIQPTSRITLTVDYWQTKISNVIIPVTPSADVFSQYYMNNGVVNIPGITVLPNPVGDVNNPNASGQNALPLLGYIIGSYKNADKFLARGIDFSASARVPLGSNGLSWTTQANASLLLRLQQTTEDGTVQRYDNSLGPCNITSCSGSPKWRLNWQNTLNFGDRASFSLTAYYTSGFSQVATDTGGVYGDCQTSVDNGQIASFPDGTPVRCRSKSVFYMDAHAETKVTDRLSLYVDMRNIFDRKPSFDATAAYGLYGFNPAWSDALFIGRFMRVGARVDF